MYKIVDLNYPADPYNPMNSRWVFISIMILPTCLFWLEILGADNPFIWPLEMRLKPLQLLHLSDIIKMNPEFTLCLKNSFRLF